MLLLAAAAATAAAATAPGDVVSRRWTSDSADRTVMGGRGIGRRERACVRTGGRLTQAHLLIVGETSY